MDSANPHSQGRHRTVKEENVYQKGGELKNMPFPVLGPFWVELSRTPQRAGNTIGEASGSTVANVLIKDTRHLVAFVTQSQSPVKHHHSRHLRKQRIQN